MQQNSTTSSCFSSDLKKPKNLSNKKDEIFNQTQGTKPLISKTNLTEEPKG